MKFVTLALALLLAVGSQAVPLQADAPPMLAHARSVADMYIAEMKTGLLNSLGSIEDVEIRRKVKEHLGTVFQGIDSARANLAPMTDTVVSTAIESTADFRNGINADVQALKEEIEPMLANLRTVVENHIAGYKEKFGGIIDEYQRKHNEEMELLRIKLEPIMTEMQGKIQTNVEETKAALTPIVSAVYGRVKTWVSNARDVATPYVTEYRDQLTEAAGHIRTPTMEEVTALKEKVEPLTKEIAANFQAIFAEASKVLTKA